jgi:hypothetical protein
MKNYLDILRAAITAVLLALVIASCGGKNIDNPGCVGDACGTPPVPPSSTVGLPVDGFNTTGLCEPVEAVTPGP